jgi:hypothetical protein
MNIIDVNKVLVTVIVCGWFWLFLRWLSMRSVAQKREAAAKLLADAVYQEHMEAEAVRGRELAAEHLAERRLELGLDSSDDELDGRETGNAAAFSPEAAK